jgi:hypothetical protein
MMYIVAFALRIVGGCVGGLISRTRFNSQAGKSMPVDQPV